MTSLDQDRIVRTFLGAIDATVRTNAFLPDRRYLSIKLRSADVPDMPKPFPLYEIFVYSPEMEAIHLRGGRVARGGIRWSDRKEDYRTEVLGLMKAQKVKNAVIVPDGSKGGFVLKRTPSTPDDLRREVSEQYVTMMRGLLDITDNRVDGRVVHPEGVRVSDEEDPYLVVAADKGTATFSDTANAVAAEYGFWLGDAFASGGSAGYDHKKLAITARGAWESVKRHFREMGIDTQTDPSGRWGSATCRATCSATGCCCRRRCASSARSTTGTSSSTRTPIRRSASSSGAGSSSSRVRRGPTTTHRPCRREAACTTGGRRASRCRRRRARRSASPTTRRRRCRRTR